MNCFSPDYPFKSSSNLSPTHQSNQNTTQGTCFLLRSVNETVKKTTQVHAQIEEKKDAKAFLRLAEEFEKQEDFDNAFINYQSAAILGNVMAQLGLATCYFKGLGTKQDNAKAEHWFKTVLGDGYETSNQTINACKYDAVTGLAVLSKLKVPKVKIICNQNRRIFVYVDGESKFFVKSKGEEDYLEGIRSKKEGNIDKAIKSFLKVYRLHPLASFELGLIYLERENTTEGKGKAKKYLTHALEKDKIQEAQAFLIVLENTASNAQLVIDGDEQGKRFARSI